MKQNKIYFELPEAGLFNQVLSIEVAVGLSIVYDKDVVIYGPKFDNTFSTIFVSPFDNKDNDFLFNNNFFPHITNLLNFNVNDRISFVEKEKIKNDLKDSFIIKDLSDYYFSCNDFSDKELFFSSNRKKLNIPNNKNINIIETLSQYSSFFFNRTSILDNALSKIKFNKEYYELAKIIATSIGKFNGGHLRLTDNQIQKATLKNVTETIDLFNKDLPFFLCTDEPSNDIIIKNKNKIILLDEYIINNFKTDFMSLTFNDEVSFGLLCNLTMHYCIDFVGSFASTYTSYIQRNSNQNKLLLDWKTWSEQPHTKSGPFSWNGHPDEQNACWYLEWPESYLNPNTFPSTL